MCVNYTPSRKDQISATFEAIDETGIDWRPEVWQDYEAPFINHDHLRQRRVQVGSYGMIPKSKMPLGTKRFSTMNARVETVSQLRSFARAWQQGQRCLIPLHSFFEPNYEQGRAERWEIGLHEQDNFAVAGLFRLWDEVPGSTSFSFTQLTINADQHPLLNRFHKPGEEKRSLAILRPEDYQAWLESEDLEYVRQLLRLPQAEQCWAKPAALAQTQRGRQPPNKADELAIIAKAKQLALF